MVSQRWLATAAVAAATFGMAAAQTTSKCNPHKGAKCPDDQAFGGQWTYDFTSKSSVSDLKADWNIDGGVEFGNPATLTFDKTDGARFTMSVPDQSPTINTTRYLFFGKVDVVMKAAPGAGIVSSIVLQSDDQDEIDWEFIGSHGNEAQTNFYRWGDNNGAHGQTHGNLKINPISDFHKYTIEWTDKAITWSIDDSAVRTAARKDVPGDKYPQSPCQLKIGAWPAGDSSQEGTSQWAGGKVNWNQKYIAAYKSVTITDYGYGHVGAKAYAYADSTGDMDKIVIKGGKPGSPTGSSGSTGTTTTSSPQQTDTGVPAPGNGTVPTGTGSSGPTSTTKPSGQPSNPAGRVAAPLAGLGLLGLLLL